MTTPDNADAPMTDAPTPPPTPAAEPVACPNCGAPTHAGDDFCEECGHTLTESAVAAATDAGAAAPPASNGPDATQLVPAPGARAARPTDDTVACTWCGSTMIEDGFCSACGVKVRTRREHWTESPRADLGGVCDKGILHARNEDGMALAVGGTPEQFSDGRMVIVVCDGVTTAPDSDRASLVAAVDAANSLLGSPVASADGAAAVAHWDEQLRIAAAAANAAAVGVARMLGNPKEPPSCTFVAAVAVTDPAAQPASTLVSVGWCGDSRAYWIGDDGDHRQLMVDHSLGTQLIESGMSPDEAERHPASHTITRWLGADSVNPHPEISSTTVASPGWLLVCSDGLWNYASHPAALSQLIGDASAALGTKATPTAIAESLAAWANERGGHDNITVALGRLNDPAPLPVTPTS